MFIAVNLFSPLSNAFEYDDEAGAFGGCDQFCDAKFLRIKNPDQAGYRRCIDQTRNEKKCGGGTKTSGGKSKGNTPKNEGEDPEQVFQKYAKEACQSSCTIACVQESSGWVCPNAKQGDEGGNRTAIVQCQAQFDELLQECRDASASAINYCDETKDSGMSGVTDTAAQVALMLGQQTAGSIQAACSKMANLSQMASTALVAYRTACSTSIQSCNTSCDSAISYLKENQMSCFAGMNATQAEAEYNSMVSQVKSEIKTCNSLNAKMEQAGQAINNYGNTALQSTQCGDESSGVPDVPDLCKTYPNSPGCNNGIVDCNNPTMATNKVCICSKNPTDPTCVGTKNSGSDFGNGGGIDSSSRAPNANVSGGLDGGDLPYFGIEQGKANRSAGNSIDGKMGGGSGIGGGDSGGGGGAAGGGRGGAGEEDPLQVNAGFYGSGGGGSFGGGPGGGGSGGSGGGARGANGAAAGNGLPDLRSFLPGGKMDPRQRGLAGSSGVDGITGPHSNIWQKIQNRYQSMSPTLLP